MSDPNVPDATDPQESSVPDGSDAMRIRRRARNLLLEPRLQLALPGWLLAITFVFLSAEAFQAWLAFSGFFAAALDGSLGQASLLVMLESQWHDFVLGSAVIATGYVLTLTGFTVAYLHKMVGPVVAFRRHVHALAQGDSHSRVRLREGDAFAGLAADLNELAEALEDAEKPRQ